MNPKDLKKGDYIYEKYITWDYAYIVKIGSRCGITIYDNGRCYFDQERGCDLGNNRSSIRQATTEEIDWLNACIKAGKFVSKEQVIANYEIY
jgi:hypothetical protein